MIDPRQPGLLSEKWDDDCPQLPGVIQRFRRLLDGSGNELSEDYGNGQESAWQPDTGSLGKGPGQLLWILGRSLSKGSSLW